MALQTMITTHTQLHSRIRFYTCDTRQPCSGRRVAAVSFVAGLITIRKWQEILLATYLLVATLKIPGVGLFHGSVFKINLCVAFAHTGTHKHIMWRKSVIRCAFALRTPHKLILMVLVSLAAGFLRTINNIIADCMVEICKWSVGGDI